MTPATIWRMVCDAWMRAHCRHEWTILADPLACRKCGYSIGPKRR